MTQPFFAFVWKVGLKTYFLHEGIKGLLKRSHKEPRAINPPYPKIKTQNSDVTR